MKRVLSIATLALALGGAPALVSAQQGGSSSQGGRQEQPESAVSGGSVDDRRNAPTAGEENRTPASDRGRDINGNDPNVVGTPEAADDPRATGTAGQDANADGSEGVLGATGLVLFAVALTLAGLFARGMMKRKVRRV